MAQAMRKRLERLPEPFWQVLRDGDYQLATQVAFCAALARNLLLVEFLETVVADAFVTRAETLQPYQLPPGEVLEHAPVAAPKPVAEVSVSQVLNWIYEGVYL